jgi:hypothetical protein
MPVQDETARERQFAGRFRCPLHDALEDILRALRSRPFPLSPGYVLLFALPLTTSALAKVGDRNASVAETSFASNASADASAAVLLAKKGEKKPAKGKKQADDDKKNGDEKGDKKDGERADDGKKDADNDGPDRAAKAEAWKAKRIAAENSKHALRLAKIEKIEAIAAEKTNAELTAQAAKLRDAETKRHTAHLEKIEEIAKKRGEAKAKDDDDKAKDDKKAAKGAGKGKAGKPAKKGGR